MNIAQTKQNGQPVTLFTKEDIEIMFTTFDITGRGYCSSSQLKRGKKFNYIYIFPYISYFYFIFFYIY